MGLKLKYFIFFYLKSNFIGLKFKIGRYVKMNKTFISNTRAIQASLSH